MCSLDTSRRSSRPRRRPSYACAIPRRISSARPTPSPARGGAILFDYANNSRREAENAGVHDFSYPGFVPAFIRPLFCEGDGPFRWAALSGEASDIARTDQLVLEMFPHDEHLNRWIKLAQKRVKFQGLPS